MGTYKICAEKLRPTWGAGGYPVNFWPSHGPVRTRQIFVYFAKKFVISSVIQVRTVILSCLRTVSTAMMTQMVDRSNTIPIGQERKTLTFKALL